MSAVVSICARVCPSWWRVVQTSPAYGKGLPDAAAAARQGDSYYEIPAYENAFKERERVLKLISSALWNAREGYVDEYEVQRDPGELDLYNGHLGEDGCRALGSALQAMPPKLLALTEIGMKDCGLTAAGIAAGMRCGFGMSGLRVLSLPRNIKLGDSGLATLAEVLPATLRHLDISETGCADAGMVVVAAALPRLVELRAMLCRSAALGQTGWFALVDVLPQLPQLESLDASRCRLNAPEHSEAGLQNPASAGGLRLATVLPQCSRTLLDLNLTDNFINERSKVALRAAWAFRDTVENPMPESGLLPYNDRLQLRDYSFQMYSDDSWDDIDSTSDTDDYW